MSNIPSSGPFAAEIMSTPLGVGGYAVGPRSTNMGMNGPARGPFVTWEPRGTDGRYQQTMAAQLNYGIAPKKHGHIALKSFEFISVGISALTDLEDGTGEIVFQEGELIFVVRRYNIGDGVQVLLPLRKLNALSQRQWDTFIMQSEGDMLRNPQYDSEAAELRELMTKYGEQILCDYARARANGVLGQVFKGSNTQALTDLDRYHHLALQDRFCYLTKFGFLRRVNYLGVCIFPGQAMSLPDSEYMNTHATDHQTTVTVGVAKRLKVVNCFGPNSRIMCGSRLWLTLTRKCCGSKPGRAPQFGAFHVVPGGSNINDKPLECEHVYCDETGAQVSGHYWPVGAVINGSKNSPQPGTIERACCIGHYTDERDGAENLSALPNMWVAFGYRH